ncbi:MAG: zinc dependent phospholipase C family protein [Clostridia bacterium]|nr:zinc dependent phospholipase C family protein [Clostridia bacterium]
MASWMIHLRVADGLLELLPDDIEKTEFVVGNIAPDSGVPNEDWSSFSPSTDVSHFKKKHIDGRKEIDVDRFISENLTKDKIASYDDRALSFFLGYYSHLLCDVLWVDKIYDPCCALHKEEYASDKVAFTWKIKEDWYDLDFKYLRDHPFFRTFEIYRGANGFENDFLDVFARDAFDNRRKYIVSFYGEKREGLDREYPFLTEEKANEFVEDAVVVIKKEIEKILLR